MRSRTLKMLAISLIALMTFSCASFQTNQTAHVSQSVVQFEQAQKPVKPGNLGSFASVDPLVGAVVCFPVEKAKTLRLYIDQLEQALDRANVTIDNANKYIKRFNR